MKNNHVIHVDGLVGEPLAEPFAELLVEPLAELLAELVGEFFVEPLAEPFAELLVGLVVKLLVELAGGLAKMDSKKLKACFFLASSNDRNATAIVDKKSDLNTYLRPQ